MDNDYYAWYVRSVGDINYSRSIDFSYGRIISPDPRHNDAWRIILSGNTDYGNGILCSYGRNYFRRYLNMKMLQDMCTQKVIFGLILLYLMVPTGI